MKDERDEKLQQNAANVTNTEALVTESWFSQTERETILKSLKTFYQML